MNPASLFGIAIGADCFWCWRGTYMRTGRAEILVSRRNRYARIEGARCGSDTTHACENSGGAIAVIFDGAVCDLAAGDALDEGNETLRRPATCLDTTVRSLWKVGLFLILTILLSFRARWKPARACRRLSTKRGDCRVDPERGDFIGFPTF